MSYTYRYTGDNPTAFIALRKNGQTWVPYRGDTITSDEPISHPWLVLIEDLSKTTDDSKAESAVTVDSTPAISTRSTKKETVPAEQEIKALPETGRIQGELIMPFMSANSFWGCAKEVTYGTPAAVTTFTPIGSPKVVPTVKWLDDSDFRGSPAMHYDQVPGVIHATFDGKTYMYSDVYPNLLVAALGGPDSVASSVHTIGLLNAPNSGSQAPSYTIINDSVDNTYNLTAARLVDLSLSFAADAAVETTFSFTGNAASVVASVSANESVQHFVPAWNCSASIGGASVTVVESATLDIKRGTAPIFTIGQQGPYNNFQGPIEVAGSLVFVVESGETYYTNSLTRDQQQVLLQFTDPATGYFVKFQMSAVQLQDPVIDQGKSYVTLQAKYTAVANTTDATSAGYSPIKAIVSNNVASAY